MSLASPQPSAPHPVPEISPTDAHRLLGERGALLLDVREPDEYAAAHVDGARLLPLGQLQAALTPAAPAVLDDLPRAETVVVICRSGRRSAEAVQFLQRAGFADPRNLAGGIIAWRAAGLPVVE
jgi:rhodanese-related sulfurtransferase